NNLSTDGSLRRLTLFGLDSYYYPIGARGVAPFATTELGLARVTESAPATQCPLLLCQDTVSTSSQIALAFGLGVRLDLRGGEVGVLLAGVYSAGDDRGIAQGLHGGIGCDVYSGRVMWNVNSRLLWLKRHSGENVFGVQVGLSLSPKVGR